MSEPKRIVVSHSAKKDSAADACPDQILAIISNARDAEGNLFYSALDRHLMQVIAERADPISKGGSIARVGQGDSLRASIDRRDALGRKSAASGTLRIVKSPL